MEEACRQGGGTGTEKRLSSGSGNDQQDVYKRQDENEEWVYIESGDVRGFVNKKYLKTGTEVTRTVEEKGEENFPTAREIIEPEKNKACYYTLTSIKSGVPGSSVRQSVLEFASQFIGNPYVWGGTSLTAVSYTHLKRKI